MIFLCVLFIYYFMILFQFKNKCEISLMHSKFDSYKNFEKIIVL